MSVLLQEMQKMFTRYKSIMLSVNLRAPELQRAAAMNRGWSRACSAGGAAGQAAQQVELQALWAQLQPEDGAEEEEESREAQEKLHVTGSKLKLLLRQVEQDLSTLPPQLGCESASEVQGQSSSADPKKGSSPKRERRDLSPPRSSFFYRVLRAAFPLHLLFLFLLLLPCIIPWSESEPGCTAANNFARSFYPMLKYTNGPPPT
ncbi:hypothetical protein F7725_019855 [Dissostichus mawsoni]|uniref:KASH domain-containing protein n=1 Tax=Dissostichus mawsoni TaxID=36200 RepID=A0A7J5YKX1_DISMA|nr:hypothetical protein F7725_019855 [Dissostichus mawsoni]